MTNPQILKKVQKLEAFAQMALEEATAIRKELEGGTSNSPARDNKKAAIHKVLANRNKFLNLKKTN